MFRKYTLFLNTSIIAVSMMSMPTYAAAEDKVENSNNFQLEEIIVTSRKRGAEALQDIPSSIIALSGNSLEKMGVSDFSDFAYQIPGLTFTDTGAGEKAYIIRGVRSAGQQQVAVYYDEIPLPGVQSSTSDSGAQTTDLKLFDLNRVEVLKGPQGTTFGANSQIGTVRFILNKPNLSEIEAKVKLGSNFVKEGGVGASAYGMINLPISEDKLALRFVGYFDREAGYIDNVRLGWDNINWIETSGLRAMARFTPTENVTVDVMGWWQNRENGGSSRYHPFDTYGANPLGDSPNPITRFQTGELKVGDYTYTGKPDNQQIYSMTLNWDMEWANLTATGSYYKRDFDFKFDSTWIIYFLGVSPTNRPDLVPAVTDQKQDLEQKSFEIRLNSQGDNAFNWMGGVFYRNRDSNFQSFVPIVDPVTGRTFDPGTPFTGPSLVPGAGIPGCHPCVFARENVKSIEELALFGEVTYEISEKLEIMAGLRWFKADQEDIGQVVFNFALFTDFIPEPTPGQFDENRIIPKFQITYRINDDVTIFALASKGTRLGGTNQQGVVAVPVGFTSDSLWNYEIGLKTRWNDGRLILNMSAFYIDWSNIQVSGDDPTGAFSFVGNAGGATVQGLEVELQAHPTDQLSFTAGASWLPKAELNEDQISTTIVASGKKGDLLPNIPKLTLNATAQYSFDLAADDWNGWLRGEVSYRSKTRIQLYPSHGNNRIRNAYTLANLRLGFANEKWDTDIVLYLENAFDKRADVAIGTGGGEPTWKITARPRTVGVELIKRF